MADSPQVSAVIYNRIRAKMPLQIDATLCYIKPGGCPPVPNNADKLINSPYNTYKIAGLPPTPIASVTTSALRAALAPGAGPVPLLRDRGLDREARVLHHAAAAERQHRRGPEKRPAVTVPVTGHTRVAGIIGEPVAQSRSPAIHNAAYAAGGLDWVYVAFPVRPGEVARPSTGSAPSASPAATSRCPTSTKPRSPATTIQATAAAIGVVNTVLGARRPTRRRLHRRSRLRGRGPRRRGRPRPGPDPRPRRGRRGARHRPRPRPPRRHRRVWGRRLDAAATTATLAPTGDPVPTERLDETVAASGVIVNATPLGMRGERPPFDTGSAPPRPDGDRRGRTRPADTPLLAAAARPGRGHDQRARHARPPGGPVVHAPHRMRGPPRRDVGRGTRRARVDRPRRSSSAAGGRRRGRGVPPGRRRRRAPTAAPSPPGPARSRTVLPRPVGSGDDRRRRRARGPGSPAGSAPTGSSPPTWCSRGPRRASPSWICATSSCPAASCTRVGAATTPLLGVAAVATDDRRRVPPGGGMRRRRVPRVRGAPAREPAPRSVAVT